MNKQTVNKPEARRTVDRLVMRKCAACGAEQQESKMSVCMHNQMHRYVCDMKCMIKFYA